MRQAGAVRACLMLLVVAASFAGCVTDVAPVPAGLTLIEAHEAAWPRALRMDASASLAGFVARDGDLAATGEAWLQQHAGDVPPPGGDLGSGRAAHWVLLYVTPQGGVIRAHAGAVPGGVDLDWVGSGEDTVAQSLWAMNLGGRLLVDSPAAIAAAQDEPAVKAHLAEHPRAPLSVSATLAPVDGDGTLDLAYAFHWGPAAGGAGEAFAVFAHVHHATGRVLSAGDASDHARERTVVLVDESFTLGPVPREAAVEETLAVRVTDGRLHLEVSGAGSFTLRIVAPDGTDAAHVEDVVMVGPETYEEDLGTMEPGAWALQVEVLGRLDFTLRIEGVVPVAP